MAMKRGKPDPLINEVAFCVRMGWTLEDLYNSPSRFVELVQIYLNTENDIANREKESFKADVERIIDKSR